MYISFKKIKDIIKTSFEGSETQPTDIDNWKTHKILSALNEAYLTHLEDLALFTVLFRRFGDEEGHTYLGGTYTTLEEAIAVCQEEYEYRGGKYDGHIYKGFIGGSTEKVFDLGELHVANRKLKKK